MKKLAITTAALILITLISPFALAAYDSAQDAQADIDAYYATLPLDETDMREIDLVYPDDFGGMYVDEDNYVVVCIVGDIESSQQFYIDEVAGGDASLLRFVEVDLSYDTLDQYYVTIGAKHVSTKLNIINLYKTKRFEINSRENRVDIWLFANEDERIEVSDYLHGIFADGIYIYYTDENGENVIENEDEVRVRAEQEAANAPVVAETEEPTMSEQIEDAGINVKNIVIPIIIVAVIIVALFAISKIRSRNTDLDEDEDNDK